MTIEAVELAPPKEKEVLVKIAYTEFCHPDLHVIKGTVDFSLVAMVLIIILKWRPGGCDTGLMKALSPCFGMMIPLMGTSLIYRPMGN